MSRDTGSAKNAESACPEGPGAEPENTAREVDDLEPTIDAEPANAIEPIPPLAYRVRLVVTIWHIRLREWARSMVAMLRARDVVARLEASAPMRRVYIRARALRLPAGDIQDELRRLHRLHIPWGVSAYELRRLPEGRLIDTLIVASDFRTPARVRVTLARRLVPAAAAIGGWGIPIGQVLELLNAREEELRAMGMW